MGAQHRTTNFVVVAPNDQIAQQVGQWAEHYRREKAVQWLGQEMPTWPQPCPLYVQVSMEGPRGATSFQFGQGRVLSMKMEIAGPLDRLIHSVLPHEITHTVFAHYFRCPVPRWADEGGSVLSEDGDERDRHDQTDAGHSQSQSAISGAPAVQPTDYPEDMSKVMCLYAQGYSLSDYLVKRSDRRNFLAFVATGMQPTGWDQAVQSFYGHRSVEELEEAWLKHLRERAARTTTSSPRTRRPDLNSSAQDVGSHHRAPGPAARPMPSWRGRRPRPIRRASTLVIISRAW